MNYNFYDLINTYAKELFIERINKIEKLFDGEFYEIMINSWSQVFVENREGIVFVDNVFTSAKEYSKNVSSFLASYNQRLSVDKPIINFDVKGKYRINVINSNISGKNTIITIRKNGGNRFEREAFISSGFANEIQMSLLEKCVLDKKTIFISGETSSGKTTLLNYLLKSIPFDERIIIIEDTKEINISSKNNAIFLRTTEQEFNVKGVSTSDLVKASLRMRPDRIIVSEIRRDEIVDYLHAINTGHSGSISTGHGNSPEDMLIRLEMLLLEAGIPYNAVKRYLGRGIDIIVQLEGKRNRKISSISEITYRDLSIEVKRVA